MPYHRKKIYFKETLKSIKQQTFKKFELIIVYDDYDKSELIYVKKILSQFKIKTKLIINKNIIGAGLSRNKALKISKGNFIAFCDADDTWKKNKLKFQINFMKKNNIEFSHSDYDIIDSYSKKIGHFKIPKIITKKDLLKCCDIGLSSVMVSQRLLKKEKFSSLKTKEDYLLWIQMIKYTIKFIGIKKKLVCWRKLDNSLSSSIFQKLKDAFRLYKFNLKFSFLYTIFCVLRLSYYTFKKKIIIYL